MKKYLFILLAAVAFVACSNDDLTHENTIAPIADKKIGTEIKTFFESELSDSLPDGRNKFGLDAERNIEPLVVPYVDCRLINSREELEGQYKGEKEIPQIDFSAYSLVIGKVIVMWKDWTMRLEMQEEDDFLKLTAYLHDKHGGTTWDTLSFDYFWNLYPKLPSKPLQPWFSED